jgi:P27 family predicted phage terminase small subunit
MRGRKPKPSHLKLITGNPGRRKLPKDEPKPAPAVDLAAPEHLSAGARAHWAQVAKELAEAKVLTRLDLHGLGMYCEAFARWTWANAQIQKHGVLVKTPNGFPTQSPLLQIANKAFEQMRVMLAEFGMTPSARTRVATAQGAKRDGDELDDPWDAL